MYDLKIFDYDLKIFDTEYELIHFLNQNQMKKENIINMSQINAGRWLLIWIEGE